MLHYIMGDEMEYPIFCETPSRRSRRLPQEASDMNRRLIRMLGTEELFGTVRIVKTNDRKLCVLMYPERDGRTDYTGFRHCLEALAEFIKENIEPETPIALPHGIGCGRGWGSWDVVRVIIEHFADLVPNEVYVCIASESKIPPARKGAAH